MLVHAYWVSKSLWWARPSTINLHSCSALSCYCSNSCCHCYFCGCSTSAAACWLLSPTFTTHSHSFYEWSSHTCTDTSTKLWQRTCETVIVILQPPAIIVYMHWQVVPSLLFLLYGKFSLSCIRKCIQTSYRQANHWCWKRFFFIFMLSRHWLDKMNKNISRYCKSFMLKRVIEKLKLTRGNCRFWFIVNLTFILR